MAVDRGGKREALLLGGNPGLVGIRPRADTVSRKSVFYQLD